MLEHMKIHGGENIGHAQRPRCVARTSRHKHLNDTRAYLICLEFKLLHLLFGNVFGQCQEVGGSLLACRFLLPTNYYLQAKSALLFLIHA